MIGRVNVSGGGRGAAEAFAYIHVTYTAGAVCTATNGSATFSAPNTSGSVVFAIPEPSSLPETWTIAVTNGTLNKTTSVSITAQYQFEDIVLYLSRLPEGYQEVEYLESTAYTMASSTSYGMIELASISSSYPNDSSQGEINLAFMLLGDPSAYIWNVFGRHDGGIYNTAVGSQNVGYIYGGTNVGWSNATANTKMNVTINQNGTRAVVENGVTIGTCSGSVGGKISACSIVTSTGSTRVNSYGMRIYEITISNNAGTALTYDYAPCVRASDGYAGYYDLINDQFYYASGNRGISAGGYV